MKAKALKLGDFTKIRTGKLDANASSPDGQYPFFTCAKNSLRIGSYSYDCECVLVAGNGDLNVKYYHGKFDAYQRTYIIEAKTEAAETINIRYLYHFLETYLETLREKSIGGIIKYIKLGDLTNAYIPLPPIPEQKRIAQILDAAYALRAKRRESIAQLDALVQSTFLEMFGDPVTNTKRWNTALFEDLLDRIDSGWSPKCLARAATKEEWGILKLGAVTSCKFDERQQKALPGDIDARSDIEVKSGDLLFTRKNTHDLVAAAALVHTVRPKLLMPDLIFRLVPKSDSDINVSFLWQLLVQPRQRKLIQSLAGGAAGSMPNISKAKLKKVVIIKPPLDLQLSYASIVESIEAQKSLLQNHLTELNTLFASLQSRAFNGEL